MKIFFLFIVATTCLVRPVFGDYDVTVTGSTSGSVWGSSPYTDDSSVATAAVHRGLISAGQAATIHVALTGPQSSFAGTTANGVTTQSYGYWGGSYTLSLVSPANQAPVGSIAGASTLTVGQSGSWTYSATDGNANLKQWRVSLLPAQAQWTSISGGSQTGSFSYSFSSPGTYTWQLQVEDWAGASHTSTWSVTVSSAPANRPPTSSISGSSNLTVGQSGTWTYSATDPDANLKQWRVSLLPNTAQWTQVSGGSQTTSFSYSFSSAGTYTWQVAVEDLAGATSTSSCTVTVAAAPSNSLSYTVSSSYSTYVNYPQYAPNYPYLVDGQNSNGYGYASDTGAYNWLKADLGSAKLVQNIYVGGGYFSGWGYGSDYSAGAALEYSNDNVTWTTAYTFPTGFAVGGMSVSPNVVGRYWRLARSGWLATTEFRFEGAAPPVPVITSSVSAAGTVGSSFGYQITATNSPASYAASGLPAGLSLNPTTGLISGTPTAAGTANISLTATNSSGTSSIVTLVATISTSSSSSWGQMAYTTPGTYYWTAPTGVTSVSVVAVGGGGGGGAGYWAGGGGGGGGLGWKNNIAVVPGQNYLVVVGAGGGSFTAAQQTSGATGTASYFINTSVVAGFGGGGGSWGVGDANGNFAGGSGGGYVGTGGGAGGAGGTSSGDTAGGGAGAGGYSGSGGSAYAVGGAGTGGGAAAGNNGGNNGTNGAAQSGGGVGLLGQGGNGAAGTGGGGSGGLAGSANGTAGGPSNRGGMYGGGGGGQSNDGRSTPGCYGGDGAVRIIWGTGRAFPATSTGDTVPTPVITSTLSATGYANSAFSYQIVATNSPSSYSATGLPGGTAINTVTGVISGTPMAAGTFNVTIGASNGAGSDSKTLVLTIAQVTSPPAITSSLTASGSSSTSFSYQIAATNAPASYAAAYLPEGLYLNPGTGLLSGIPVAGTHNIALTATNAIGTSQTATLVLTVANNPYGEVIYATPGTYNWAVPPGVTSVAVVAVGGGGGGGGGGGALAYRNNISVTPGQSATVVIGAGGTSGSSAGSYGGDGGSSSFTYAGVSTTAGGGYGVGAVGGDPSGTRDGGAAGGWGAYQGGYSGGGAAGYTGAGGAAYGGGSYAGNGGGGGGGAWPYGSGGGVGLYGLGASGAANGGGGSGGNNGAPNSAGGAYGGGGAAYNQTTTGGGGAVRIIWGANRSFPATNTGSGPNPPIITSPVTALAAVNSAFGYQITATGSPTAYGAISLPAGLSVNPNNGLISGSPTVAGVYEVTISASNPTGTYYKRVNVTVAAAPTITTQPANQTSAVGSNATFSVAAAGVPSPTYVWRKNGMALANGGNVTGAATANLSLIGVQSSDAATYSVIVTNSAGSVTSMGATLTTVIAPAAPVAHVPTGITSTGLTANWTMVNGASKFRLDVSTDRNFSTFVSGYQNRDVGLVLSAAVPGLAVDTTYYYRVRAEAGGVAGPSSNIVSTTIPRSAGVASWQDVDGDGLMDEVSPNGVNTYAYAIDDIWLEAIETDQYVLDFNTWFDFYWPEGFYLPEFNFTWSVVPSVGGYETRLTHFHSFTAEPGYRYEIWGSRNGGGMWVKEWGPVTLTVNDNLEVGRYSGWFHPDDYLSSMFYLVRFGKPIGNVSIGGTSLPSLGSSRGLGGTLTAILPTTGGITISVKDAIGQILKAGPNIGWQVWDGINQIRVGNTTLGGLIDVGITSTGQFQVGLKLDDATTVWFNLGVTAPPPPQLAVDANRDGVIEFGPNDATTSGTPYRFWLNDDNDVSFQDLKWNDRDPEYYPPQQADSADQIINSSRDCEDLARIWINAAEFIDRVKDPASDLYLGLKWKNTTGTHPSIRLFRSADPNGGSGYIKNATIGTQQVTGAPGSIGTLRACLGDVDAATVANPPASYPWTSGITTVEPPTDVGNIRAADFVFRKDALADVFGNRATGYLLFEGVQEGKGELILLVVRKTSDGTWEKVSEGGSVWLQLDNIRRMYVRVHSEPMASNFPLPWQDVVATFPPPFPYTESVSQDHALTIPDSNLGWNTGDTEENLSQFPFVPSPGEQNKCVVFVHGVDVTVPEVHGYSESFFKRLWWEGYRGRFVSFRWSTVVSSDGTFGSWGPWGPGEENISIFNSGEYRSWKSGAALRKYVDALRTQLGPTSVIGVVGHSLGNAAVGEALRQGMRPNSYVAMEAAVSLSCYYWSDPAPGEAVPPPNVRLVNAESGHPTPLDTGSGGYYGYLASLQTIAGLNRVSYYNANDFWLATGTTAADPFTGLFLSVDWVTNQVNHKPDDRNGPGQYSYDLDLNWARFRRGTSFNRTVLDPHERMPFVSRSRTSALGASTPPPGFGARNLGQDYGFGIPRPDHSGQFQRAIQLMYTKEDGTPWVDQNNTPMPLHRRLMNDLGVAP